jgi:hypothetical protein
LGLISALALAAAAPAVQAGCGHAALAGRILATAWARHGGVVDG